MEFSPNFVSIENLIWLLNMREDLSLGHGDYQ
jgi:hypothetical protein